MSPAAWKSSLLPSEDIDHVLAYTANLWPEFRNTRLFVTGGTGFVGKWLLESFIAANERYGLNARATVLTRNPGRFREDNPHLADHPAFDFTQGDIRDFDFPEGEYTHVIHGATDMAADADPAYVYDVIVVGTRRVLQFAAERKIKKILLIGSGAVYGKQPKDVSHITEDYTGDPHTPYGKGKLAAEQLALAARVARLFAVTGPYLPLDAGYAAGNFVRDVLAQKLIHIGGDGTPLRSYLYAADMAVWLWTILAQGRPGVAYNVGGEEAISIRALADRINKLGGGVGVECALPPGGGPPDRYIPSTARARAELSLAQPISLDEGLRRMIAWNRSRL